MKRHPLRIGLFVAAALAACSLFAAKRALATLPYTEREMWEHALLDKNYGDAQAVYQDGILSLSITYGGVTVNSNNTIVLQAYANERKNATSNVTKFTSRVSTSNVASGTLPCYLSDSRSIQIASHTPTSLDASSGTGGWIPGPDARSGTAILNSNGAATLKIKDTGKNTYYFNCRLPNGRVVGGASFTG